MNVITKTHQFATGATLEVEVGTTGSKGGDSGHGGRTFLRIGDLGGSDMRVKSESSGVTLIFAGDAELENLIDGLLFAAEVLKQSRDRGTTAEMLAGATGNRAVD